MDGGSNDEEVAKIAMRRSLHVIQIKGPSKATSAENKDEAAPSTSNEIKSVKSKSLQLEKSTALSLNAIKKEDTSVSTLNTTEPAKSTKVVEVNEKAAGEPVVVEKVSAEDPFSDTAAEILEPTVETVLEFNEKTSQSPSIAERHLTTAFGSEAIRQAGLENPTDAEKSASSIPASQPQSEPFWRQKKPYSSQAHLSQPPKVPTLVRATTHHGSKAILVPVRTGDTINSFETPHTSIMNTPRAFSGAIFEPKQNEGKTFSEETVPIEESTPTAKSDRTIFGIPRSLFVVLFGSKPTEGQTASRENVPNEESTSTAKKDRTIFGIPRPMFIALMVIGFILFVSAVIAGIVFGTMGTQSQLIPANIGFATSGLFVKTNTQFNMQLFVQDQSSYDLTYRVSTDLTTFSGPQNITLSQRPSCNVALSATSFEGSDGTTFNQLFYILNNQVILANTTCPAANPATCTTLQNIVLTTKDGPMAAPDASIAAVFLGLGATQGWRVFFQNDNYQVTELTNVGGIWQSNVAVITNKTVQGSSLAAASTSSGSIEVLYVDASAQTLFTVRNLNGKWLAGTSLTTTLPISNLSPTSPLALSYASTPDTLQAFYSFNTTINEFIGLNASSAEFPSSASSATTGRSVVGWRNTPDHDNAWDTNISNSPAQPPAQQSSSSVSQVSAQSTSQTSSSTTSTFSTSSTSSSTTSTSTFSTTTSTSTSSTTSTSSSTRTVTPSTTTITQGRPTPPGQMKPPGPPAPPTPSTTSFSTLTTSTSTFCDDCDDDSNDDKRSLPTPAPKPRNEYSMRGVRRRDSSQLLSGNLKAAAGVPVASTAWKDQVVVFRLIGNTVLVERFNGSSWVGMGAVGSG